MTIDLDGMATSIRSMAGSGNADWYDLGGRKLNGNASNGKLQRGIYIRGNEKVVVKNK